MRILFILLTVIVVFACSTPIPKTGSTFVGEVPLKTLKIDSTITINPSEVIADVSFVRLESSRSCFIGMIDQILFANDKIIVFDRRKVKGIFVFDKNGKFLNRIGSLGRAANEYIDPGHIALVPGKDQVAVLDVANKKIKIYRFDGKYVGSEDLPLYILSVEYITENIKVGSIIGRQSMSIPEHKGASLLMFNKDWQITSSGFQDPYQSSMNFNSTNNLTKFADRVYYTPPYEDKIYRVYPDSLQLLYQIDFGDRAMPTPGKYKLSDTRLFGELLRKSCTFEGEFIDLRDWTLLCTADGYRMRTFLYNKVKDSVYRVEKGVSSPLEIFFNAPRYYYNDSCVVSFADASNVVRMNSWMRRFIENVPQTEKTKEQVEELSKVTENDNPILFFYTLKDAQ